MEDSDFYQMMWRGVLAEMIDELKVFGFTGPEAIRLQCMPDSEFWELDDQDEIFLDKP